MKKFRLTKIITFSLLIILGIFFKPTIAKAEWRENCYNLWYSEGNSWATGWRNIDDRWYYFDSETGYSSRGWKDIGGKWYYFSGEFLGSGDNGINWLNPLQTNKIIKSDSYGSSNKFYYVNDNGEYVENPMGEIKEYINLLNDDERMKALGILWDTKFYVDLTGHYIKNPYEYSLYLKSLDNITLAGMYEVTDCINSEEIELINENGLISIKDIKTLSDRSGNITFANGEFIVNGTLASTKTNNSNTNSEKKNITIKRDGINFNANTGKVFAYRGNDENLNIPSTISGIDVKTIGENAFLGSIKLKTVIIPESVTEIEKNAFILCDQLIYYVYSDRVKNLLINSGIDDNKIIIKK